MRTDNLCLLIDDDLDDQEIFALALQQVNPDLNFMTATSAHEALAKLALPSPRPSYIFLDLNMPRMNGKECLREIKKMPHLKDIPVVIYSTSSLRNDVVETLRLGASEFITKPFSMPELVAVLRSFFEKHHSFVQQH